MTKYPKRISKRSCNVFPIYEAKYIKISVKWMVSLNFVYAISLSLAKFRLWFYSNIFARLGEIDIDRQDIKAEYVGEIVGYFTLEI